MHRVRSSEYDESHYKNDKFSTKAPVKTASENWHICCNTFMETPKNVKTEEVQDVSFKIKSQR